MVACGPASHLAGAGAVLSAEEVAALRARLDAALT